MKSSNLSLIAALSAFGGMLSMPMPRHRREPRKPLDVRAEVVRLLAMEGSSGWRHRITGQCRYFGPIRDKHQDVCVHQWAPGPNKFFERSFRDALQWLRNADPIGGQP